MNEWGLGMHVTNLGETRGVGFGSSRVSTGCCLKNPRRSMTKGEMGTDRFRGCGRTFGGRRCSRLLSLDVQALLTSRGGTVVLDDESQRFYLGITSGLGDQSSCLVAIIIAKTVNIYATLMYICRSTSTMMLSPPTTSLDHPREQPHTDPFAHPDANQHFTSTVCPD